MGKAVGYSIPPLFTNFCYSRNFDSMAMGGGLIKSTKMFPRIQRYIRSQDLFCIAFAGEKMQEVDFNSYSVVIRTEDETVYEDEQNEIFEKELVKVRTNYMIMLRFTCFKFQLREGAILRKSGTIFRFCCYAKSFKDAENAIIEKCFPKYPLFSVDVDGEIGWNTINLSPGTRVFINF